MKNKQTYIYIILLLCCIFTLYAQKEPQYTQYMYNIGSFNPAYVGTVERPDAALLYRAQWIDVPGAPRTLRFGGNLPLNNEKMGLGLNLINEELGPLSQTYIDISYSYQIPVGQDTYLSFGLSGGGSILNLDYTKGDFQEAGDVIIGNQNQNNFYPIIGAGTFLYSDDWYVGLSAPNFLTNGIYNDEVATIVEDKTQLNFIAGYVFQLSRNTQFKPALLFNYLSGSPINVNVSANFMFLEKFTAGVAYRVDNAVSALAGFQVTRNVFLGYSYDYNTNGLGQYNAGSHEAIVKFYLGQGNLNQSGRNRNKALKGKPKQIDSPRFF